MATLQPSSLSLVNEALALIGERPFVKFDDPTTLEQQRIFEAIYETTYRAVFSRQRWKGLTISAFFTTGVTLPRTPEVPAPTDPVELLEYQILNSDGGHPNYPLAFSVTTPEGVDLPPVLRVFEMFDVLTKEPLRDFAYGFGVVHLPAEATGGAAALVGVRPPESHVNGYARQVVAYELAIAACQRLAGKAELLASLQSRADKAYRLARHHEGVLKDELPDYYGANPFNKYQTGGNESWVSARI